LKIIYTLYLVVLASPLFGQNGYVKFENDSIKVGYLRNIILPGSNDRAIELWETKKDKSPLKLKKKNLTEYAINRDTFKILNYFRPFHDDNIDFEMVEAKVIARGKLELLIIDNYANTVSSYTGGGLIPGLIDVSMGNVTFIYVLADVSNYFPQGIPARKLKFENALMDFFSIKFLNEYQRQNGKIKYKDLPDLVRAYNTLHSATSPRLK